MEKTTTYSRLEREEYNFSKYDIQVALMEKEKIPLYAKNRSVLLDLSNAGASLVITYAYPEEKKPE